MPTFWQRSRPKAVGANGFLGLGFRVQSRGGVGLGFRGFLGLGFSDCGVEVFQNLELRDI